jgi:hypothetical protein
MQASYKNDRKGFGKGCVLIKDKPAKSVAFMCMNGQPIILSRQNMNRFNFI